jgi:hypothetical protein
MALHFIMPTGNRLVEAVDEWIMKGISGSHVDAPSLLIRRGSGVESRKSNEYAESRFY